MSQEATMTEKIELDRVQVGTDIKSGTKCGPVS